METTTVNEAVVLIVEDDGPIVMLLQEVISDLGYRVLIAHGADEALTHLNMIQPSLITLDLGLPGVGGDVLIRMIRERSTTRETPIIIISAELHIDLEIRELAQAVIQKPFTINQLIETIVSLVPKPSSQNGGEDTK
jgi:DNA-binding response OmpR family regulator